MSHNRYKGDNFRGKEFQSEERGYKKKYNRNQDKDQSSEYKANPFKSLSGKSSHESREYSNDHVEMIPTELSENDVFSSWEDKRLNLSEALLKGVYSYGYEKPSEIQRIGILPFLSNKDIIAQAQSGTGKTGTFVIGLLQKMDANKQETQGIILVPTRELVLQTYNIAKHISSNMNIKIKTLFGGTPVNKDIDDLKENTYHIIIGCTGRVYDMLRRELINNNTVHTLIIDEADEMLSFGFQNQVRSIFEYMDSDVQVALFSATMPGEIMEVTKQFMVDPIKILIKSEELNLKGISQFKLQVRNDKDKYDTIKDIFDSVSISQCIIYSNSVRRVFDLYEAMKEDGYPVIYIHSNMKREERQENFREFSTGKYRVLISSDLTSRGIDIQQVAIVINFDIPNNKHTYLHRIGRSGRWGRKGLAINFITKRDQYALKHIEDWYNISIDELPSDFMKYVE